MQTSFSEDNTTASTSLEQHTMSAEACTLVQTLWNVWTQITHSFGQGVFSFYISCFSILSRKQFDILICENYTCEKYLAPMLETRLHLVREALQFIQVCSAVIAASNRNVVIPFNSTVFVLVRFKL